MVMTTTFIGAASADAEREAATSANAENKERSEEGRRMASAIPSIAGANGCAVARVDRSWGRAEPLRGADAHETSERRRVLV